MWNDSAGRGGGERKKVGGEKKGVKREREEWREGGERETGRRKGSESEWNELFWNKRNSNDSAEQYRIQMIGRLEFEALQQCLWWSQFI